MIDSTAFTKNGKYLMLALDHRGSFEKMVAPPGQTATQEMLAKIKYNIISSAYDSCSGVLIDPHYGLDAYKRYTSDNPTKEKKPFLLCIEKTGYTDSAHERVTDIEYSAEQLKQLGAQGIKLLMYFNPNAHSAEQQLKTVRGVLDQTRVAQLPLFFEIVTYQLEGEQRSKTELILESVKYFISHGIDAEIYKLEFPGDQQSCTELTDILGSIPWIMLSQGDKYEVFFEKLKIALTNGARGFLAGRSLWQEFNTLSGSEQDTFFQTTVKQRFDEIVALANP